MESKYVMARTVEELKACRQPMLNTATVAHFLRIDPGRLREYAVSGALDGMFPVFVSGNRVKFPRIGFLNWMEGKGCEE